MKFIKAHKTYLILGAIIVVGIFLRVYNFHGWLLFENDQARDAEIINQVMANDSAWPLLGPTMRASGENQETLFHIGPIYYYFQIFSAKIFGSAPDKMAYPDLLFAIFSIPLIYFLFKKYFSVNISLFLSGLYAISFFAVKYSRFAWNPNLIPFFAILFIFSLHEFFVKKEKTPCIWAGALGLAIGVGIQLHAMIFLLFPLIALVAAVYLLKQNRTIWKKILAVLVLVIFLNIPQIISEYKTGFENSRALFNSPVKGGRTDKKSKISIFLDTVSCAMEANAYILSSSGQESCNYSYVKIFEDSRAGKILRSEANWPLLILFFGVSFFGYLLLIYRFTTESESHKKSFLGLIILYGLVFFIMTLPVVGSGFKEFRYFNAVIFIPFVLVGLILDFLARKNKLICGAACFIAAFFLITTNAFSYQEITEKLMAHEGNNGHDVFLGEIENLVHYMKQTSGNSEKIYLMSGKWYSGNIYTPSAYVAKREGIEVVSIPAVNDAPKNAPLFYLTNHNGSLENNIDGCNIKNNQNLAELYYIN